MIKYSKVKLNAIGYELAPVIVTSEELEERLSDIYEKFHFPIGQLEELTGIEERRWWPEDFRISDGAIMAGRNALTLANMKPCDIEAVIYTAVAREYYEPATACRIADELGINDNLVVQDISNACLGMLSGMVDIANRIELGQIRAGMIVSCETARVIVEKTISKIRQGMDMPQFIKSMATLTGGSGAAAIILTDGSFDCPESHSLLGGAILSDVNHHRLCRWGTEIIDGGLHEEFMTTDAVEIMKHGVGLGKRTWDKLMADMDWNPGIVDKVICHQVGASNRQGILKAIEIPVERDYPTYPFLGNMGTVSLPITAGLASERGFLNTGDNTAFLGIGSGLTCMMMGLKW